MASATGTAVVNFGAAPGSSVASVAVTGQASIGSGSHCEAFLMGDSTATHNAEEHAFAPIRFVCRDVIAGTGFTIYATTELRLTGTFTVRWVWAD
jgi:hypothetical protein